MIKKIAIFLLLVLCFYANAFAQEVPLDKKLEGIYKKAEAAIAAGDIEVSDFWMARYMGLTFSAEGTKKNYSDLFPLFQRRKDLSGATALISSKFSDDFISFFMLGMHEFWGIPDKGVREDDKEFAVLGDAHGDYFAQWIISPRLETWNLMRENRIAAIPLISSEKPAFVVAGKLEDGKPDVYFPNVNINSDGRFLHYVWPIEFHDLDNDGIPEMWLRYNEAWATGFSQTLAIYKIKDGKELVLFKKFEGEAEGIARRLPDGRIEVAESFSKTDQGHLGYELHHFEIFEFKNGEFVKVSERDEPNILWSDAWEKYYFGKNNKD